jgi:hypothetical protein
VHRVGLFAVSLVLAATPARAQAPAPEHAPASVAVPPRVAVRLDYVREPGAEACPDAQGFREAVAANVGYDPFTTAAARLATVTVERRGSVFVGRMTLHDAAGVQEWAHEPLSRRDCRALVRVMGLSLAIPIDPFPGPPVSVPEAHAPAAAPPARAPVAEPPAPPAPVTRVTPGVFEGRAGLARGILYGFTAAALAAGTGFAVAASNKGDAARQLGDSLVQKGGAGPCSRGSPVVTGDCQRIVSLTEQHDGYNRAANGLFAAAAATGVAATASIWILRTPATPAMQVKPSAPGSVAGLSLQGSW